MGQISNYHRFYASLNRLPGGDREDLKEALVSSYTNGRTTSLREMTEAEYKTMCAALEQKVNPDARALYIQERKRRRSSALHQLQLYGVDTTDWNKVNAFCEQPRIAGKPFRDLDSEELEALTRKMRAIIRKRDNQQ